jgi:hypothetical protein
MNPSKFNSEKSALLTALSAQLQSCKHTLETVKRLEAVSPNGEDSNVLHIEQLIDDVQRLTIQLRDATDAAT